MINLISLIKIFLLIYYLRNQWNHKNHDSEYKKVKKLGKKIIGEIRGNSGKFFLFPTLCMEWTDRMHCVLHIRNAERSYCIPTLERGNEKKIKKMKSGAIRCQTMPNGDIRKFSLLLYKKLQIISKGNIEPEKVPIDAIAMPKGGIFWKRNWKNVNSC